VKSVVELYAQTSIFFYHNSAKSLPHRLFGGVVTPPTVNFNAVLSQLLSKFDTVGDGNSLLRLRRYDC
jgi:hypothetical protein